MKQTTFPTIFYNTQHSPIGAFATFTLGSRGAKGGLGLELAKPADQNVFIGLEEAPGLFSCLPFFDEALDERRRFDVEATGDKIPSGLRAFADRRITRTLLPGSDCWQAGDLTFVIHTPIMSAPDPSKTKVEALRRAYVPALAVEITVDNRRRTRDRRVIFGFQGNDPCRGMRIMDKASEGLSGIACGDSLALATMSPGVVSALGLSADALLHETDLSAHGIGLGGVGLLVGSVPAGRKVVLKYVACFHRNGPATTGMASRYFYTRFFPSLESVATYALKNFSSVRNRARTFDHRFKKSSLNAHRKFMLAQALHSYYGSTELLEIAGQPFWAVNEGEYRMINTFDLTVDHLFLEMELNPWTVRNELEWFAKRYSYTDKLRLPGDKKEYPGGLTFTHDMGIANHFSQPGHSVYEKAGLRGCFSYMSHEELVNWLICALVYESKTHDQTWLKETLPIFHRALESLLRRDHPDPAHRDGVMSLDSSRCMGGSEITTYDSLDVSLGQARNNLYLAGKCWGCYVGLEALFRRMGDARRETICLEQSRRAAATICNSADKKGLFPAILHENVTSRIIPAIEGLIIPYILGLKSTLSENGPHGALVKALKRHLTAVLKPGVCLFADGAWKISSTSNNSWLSKIYLCQFIAETVLQCGSKKAMERADRSHAGWLLDEENGYWAWSDQIISGVAKGSKYYPRGVTSILWLR